MSWPTIQRPESIKVAFYKKQHKSTFETGRVVTRAAHAAGRYKFILYWDAISKTDLDLLISAFESDQGSSFTWTHPRTNVSYTVTYGNDQIQYDEHYRTVDPYSVTVELNEV